MFAARYHGLADVRVETVPVPNITATQVLIAPAYNGICGTDLHEYTSGPLEYPSSPHPLTGEQNPIILGHEFSAVVVKVGGEVRELRVGDKVAVRGTLRCGEWEPCRKGAKNVCVIRGNLGQSGWGGILAGRVAVKGGMALKLPEGLGLEIGGKLCFYHDMLHAKGKEKEETKKKETSKPMLTRKTALCEPFAVSEHGISLIQPPPEPHQIVLVLGAGTIGSAAIQLLQARGIRNIVASDPSEARRQAAIASGAAHTADPVSKTFEKQVLKLTGNHGAHIIMDCAGVPASAKTAVKMVRNFGTIIQIAIHGGETTFVVDQLAYKEAFYRGSLSSLGKDWEQVIRFLEQGQVSPEKVISRVVSMEKIVEDGLNALRNADEGLLKILVKVNGKPESEEVIQNAILGIS